jgi:hypothetical protein
MKACVGRAVLWAGALALCAYGQDKGIEPEWDIRPVLKEIAAYGQRMVPVLGEIDTKGMVENGAPETYATQVNESRLQAQAVATEAAALANAPEKLSAGLQVFFRMQSLERMAGSIEVGLRKYWNPAIADKLTKLVAEIGEDRDRFQRYLVDLAAEREQEYAIMDHEAQRCRGMLAREPNAVPKTEKK